MIRFISAQETLPLRSLVLRDGLPEEQCLFDHDTIPSTLHMGYFTEDGQLTCILTLMKENHGKLPNKPSYRLRGMATHPDHLRKGHAKALLSAAINYLKDQLQIDYLWFNARTIAFPFYESMGFEFMSDEFDIPGIGPHKEMFKML